MTTRVAPWPLVLALVVSACSATTTGSGGSPSAPEPSTGREATSAVPTARSEDGPLRMTGGAGRLCIWNDSPDFVYGDDLLESAAPAEVEDVELLGDGPGLDLVSAWVMPSVGVPTTGTWAQWPLPKRDVQGKAGLRWGERDQAVGARLEAGRRYNLVIRLRRDPDAGSTGFDAVRISYRTTDAAYVLDSRTTVVFRRGQKACA